MAAPLTWSNMWTMTPSKAQKVSTPCSFASGPEKRYVTLSMCASGLASASRNTTFLRT